MTETNIAIKPESVASNKSTDKDLNKAAQTGFFNISSIAKQRIADKRKRKGLGELHQRENNVYSQFFTNGVAIIGTNTLIAPIERCRII